MIVETGKCKICWGSLAGWRFRELLQFESKGSQCPGRIPSRSGEVSDCSIKAFNVLNEAHPHYG